MKRKKIDFFFVFRSICTIFAATTKKNRNEKMRNMENPFKFGTIVEEEYFTDRVEEVAYLEQADYRDGSNEHFFKEIF